MPLYGDIPEIKAVVDEAINAAGHGESPFDAIRRAAYSNVDRLPANTLDGAVPVEHLEVNPGIRSLAFAPEYPEGENIIELPGISTEDWIRLQGQRDILRQRDIARWSGKSI